MDLAAALQRLVRVDQEICKQLTELRVVALHSGQIRFEASLYDQVSVRYLSLVLHYRVA